MNSVICQQNHSHFGRWGAAGVLIWRFRNDGEVEILLGLRSSGSGTNTWANFGGILDREDEMPQEAALREVEEEIGLKAEDLRPTGYSQNDHGGWGYTLFFATPTRLITDEDLKVDRAEHFRVAWFTREEIMNSSRLDGYLLLGEFARFTVPELRTLLPSDINPATGTIVIHNPVPTS
ncbi:hypothetical protein Hte_000432 [Hypoxylon texense]